MANETNNKGTPLTTFWRRFLIRRIVVQRVDAEATLARYEAVRRDLWATAAFAVGVQIVGAMAFVGLRDLWNDFSVSSGGRLDRMACADVRRRVFGRAI